MPSGEVRKLLAYLATGGCAAVIDVSVFMLALRFGRSWLASATLSFVVAAVFNYLASSLFVFRHALSYRRLMLFLYFAAIGLAVNVSVTMTVPMVAAVPAVLAKLCGIAVAFGFNYAVNRLVVFQDTPSRKAFS